MPDLADSPDRPDPPTPTSELDEKLSKVADQAVIFLKRVIMLMGAGMLALVIAVMLLVRSNVTEHSRIDSYLSGQCPFFYPVAIAPVSARTARLGVDLVEGARTAMAKQACPEKVLPPSSELLKLGRQYRIPIRY
jgi:hypothetical protein